MIEMSQEPRKRLRVTHEAALESLRSLMGIEFENRQVSGPEWLSFGQMVEQFGWDGLIDALTAAFESGRHRKRVEG